MKELFKKIRNDKLAMFGLIFISMMIVLSVFAFLSPYKSNGIDMNTVFLKPSLKHPFGTDSLGRDYLTRILYGTRITLLVGFFVGIASALLGTIVGAISGYIGGKVDNFIMRILEILMSIPSFFILLALSAILKSSLFEVLLVLTIFSWMGTARLIRGEVLGIKNLEYVQCAKLQGLGNFKIIRKHIIPNVFNVIIVSATMASANAILTEAMLSFLGLGLKPPTASLGSMLNAGQQNLMTSPYLVVFPSVFIILIILSFNFIGKALGRKER
ncbi:MAG: ABC transporter permease [Clostridium sp.]